MAVPDSAISSLVIAHQLSNDIAKRFSTVLPPGVSWRGVEQEIAWEVPEDAAILVAVPPRGGNNIIPTTAPPGWPYNLKWVQIISAGVDDFPKWVFDAPLVTCGRGTNSAPIAEYVLTAMLALEKKLPVIWVQDANDWKIRNLGTLRGKTLGLIGYGSIGRAIASLARPFGMDIVATTRSVQSGTEETGVRFATLDTVLAQSDHLVIASPLTPVTAGLIGRAALARVKPSVHLINIARGRIIDQDALLEALNAGRVGHVTLDVTEPEPLPAGHPFYTHPNVSLSPHVSWSAGERGHAVSALFAENLRRFIAGEPLDGLVDPEAGY